MNSDEIKGKFKEWKGELRAKWGQITDDEWDEIGGEKDRLIGKIQQRYGRSKEEAHREVDDFWREQEERERRAS